MSRVSKPHEIVERALELSTADGCVVIADEESSANLRWALQRAHHERGDAGADPDRHRDRRRCAGHRVRGGVAVRRHRRRPGTAGAGRRGRRAGAGPAEDAQPLVGKVPSSPDFTDALAETGSDVFAEFAPALGDAFARARSGGRELYGFAHHQLTSTYLGTSTGLRLRHDQPNGTLELNAKSPDRTRSTWAGRSTRDFKDVDPAELDAELAQRLRWAERRIELPAGRYETLLPPTAVADLLIYQLWSSTARDAAEGRTVFSKPGGGTRIGETLSELPLSLRSDPHAPGLESAPFVIAHASGDGASVFDNGLPLTSTDWIRDGRLEHLTTTRHTAGLTGLPVAPADRQPGAGGRR